MSDRDDFKTRREEWKQISIRQCSSDFQGGKDKLETYCWERCILLWEKAAVNIFSVVFQAGWYLKSGELLQDKYFKYSAINSLFYQPNQMHFDRKFRAW